MREDIHVFRQYADEKNAFQVLMAGVSYCDATYRIERSHYDYYVIEHVIEGKGVLETDGQRYEIGPKDTYFLYRGRPHTYYCKGESWTKIWVVVDGSLVEALFCAYLRERPNVIRGFDVYANMMGILEAAKDKNISYEQLNHKAALNVHRILIGVKEFMEQQTADLAAAVKNYMDASLDKSLQLEEVAGQFHYSKNHIINIFRNRYGETPYVYYERQKLQVAKELLVNTSLSIGQISKKLGYDNPQYFSKCFKKYYGIQPTGVRKGQKHPQ